MPALIPVVPPFGNNSPPWYNNGVWGQLGCAIAQPGRYLQTCNEDVWDFVDSCGLQLFSALWRFRERMLRGPLGRECAWAYYQLLFQGMKKLDDMTVKDGASSFEGEKINPTYQMFRVFPVPFYGRLGNVNGWLQYAVKKTFRMLTEAMQHPDNVRPSGVTERFNKVCKGPILEMLIDLATSHFGYTRDEVLTPGFSIPDIRWGTDPVQGYKPGRYIMSSEAESTLPPPGWVPNAWELEPLGGLAITAVLPLCQPWPEQQLFYSPGGVWAGQTGAAAAIAGSSVADPTLVTNVPNDADQADKLAKQLGVGAYAEGGTGQKKEAKIPTTTTGVPVSMGTADGPPNTPVAQPVVGNNF